MNVASYVKEDGIDVKVSGKDHFLGYPEKVWRSYSPQNRRVLMDNLAFISTVQMPNLTGVKRMEYNTAYPLFASVFFENVINDLLYTADDEPKSSLEEIKKFLNTDYAFDSYDVKHPDRHNEVDESAVISFTFGKESLLNYAVCKELGMKTHLVFTKNALENKRIENYYSYQGQHVARLSKILKNKFKEKLDMVNNELLLLSSYEYLKIKETCVSLCTLMTMFTLSMLPFNNHYRSKYLLFGNEQSCNDSYINKDGFRCYPVFDQSSIWTRQMDNVAKIMSFGKVHVTSLVEPLHEMAIVKILHNRYKDLGRLQMSCFSENKFGKDSHWCQNCSKCARIFLFLKANGIEVTNLGFRGNMFSKESRNLFSLMRHNGDEKNIIMYDKTGTGRDEQLLAFYLAHKRGETGYLMDEFRELHLKEAIAREDELFKKFFTVYEPINMPKQHKSDVLSIYREELKEIM